MNSVLQKLPGKFLERGFWKLDSIVLVFILRAFRNCPSSIPVWPTTNRNKNQKLDLKFTIYLKCWPWSEAIEMCNIWHLKCNFQNIAFTAFILIPFCIASNWAVRMLTCYGLTGRQPSVEVNRYSHQLFIFLKFWKHKFWSKTGNKRSCKQKC